MKQAAISSQNLVHYNSCPVCGSAQLVDLWPVVDHSVSGQEFMLVECADCKLRLTQDVPDREHIGPYYQSTDYISHSNTKKGFINRIYHLVRKRTLKSKRKLIEKSVDAPNGRILDIGAGVGAFVSEMKKHGWQITGLEPDAGARERARQDFGITLMDMDALNKLPSASFDAITLWHVLEHIHPLNDYMTEFRRLLAPGAALFIAVPNYTSYDAAFYGPSWAAYDVPRHLYHFSPLSMRKLFERHQLQFIREIPMPFDSYYVSLLSNKYQSGRMQWHKAIWRGWLSNLRAGRNKASSMIYIGK